MSDVPPVALVTGANRGIGFEVCKQLAERGYVVLLGARDPANGAAAADALRTGGADVRPLALDVSSDDSVRAAVAEVSRLTGRLDVLVNNAGGGYDADQVASAADLARVREVLELNLLGVWRVCRAFAPMLKASGRGRLVNVSSEAGSLGGTGYFGLSRQGGAVPAYGVSKAAVNALTVLLAAELAAAGVKVNAVCPGFTATQPGTAEMGARPVADGAASVVWAATLPADGPTGGFFRDGQPLAW